MIKDNLISEKNLAQNVVNDELTNFLRESACKMLKIAIESEVNEFILKHEYLRANGNKKRIVRNGYLPERKIKSGIGDITVKMPRIRDRLANNDNIQFTSSLIPKYMRRTVTLDIMLPILYLKGISTGDFQNVLTPMLGANAKSISPGVISKLKESWLLDYKKWFTRDLSNKRYVYWWADGVYLSARMETDKTCMLVIVGADEHGKKELVGLIDGFRESKESWLELLNDLQKRGLNYAPHLSVGDGALGFWGALSESYPKTKHQRCWVHKTKNILNKLPKSQQNKAKSKLHEIYLAETKKDALKAFNDFTKQYSTKYCKAVECLKKDKEELLNFYNFPAEHWQHIRTTNPIESTFATVKHRTRKSKGCFSRNTIIASTFKLLMEAQQRWKRLYGYRRLAEVINLVKFVDGEAETSIPKVINEKAA
jgi:transposase-like protein